MLFVDIFFKLPKNVAEKSRFLEDYKILRRKAQNFTKFSHKKAKFRSEPLTGEHPGWFMHISCLNLADGFFSMHIYNEHHQL